MRALAPFIALFVGCGGGGKADTWWALPGDDLVEGTGTPPSGFDGEDEDDEDEEQELEAVFWGDLTATDGAWSGACGMFLYTLEGVQCDLTFEPTDVTPTEACASCDTAVEFTLSDLFVEVGDGCSQLGVDPASLDGSRLGVGVAGDTAYWNHSGGWEPAGDGEATASEMYWDIWLE